MINDELKEYIKREIAQATQIPVGAIFAFPSENIPEGFLPCEGQELSRTQYPKLFELIGTAFGGGNKTFCLPDLQGQFIRGLDRMGNVDKEDGNARQLGVYQADAIQGHRHTAGETSFDGSHLHEYYESSNTIYYGTNTISDDKTAYLWSNSDSGARNKTNYSGSHSHKFSIGSVSNDSYGKIRVASETRPKNIALIFCIKVQ